MLTTGLALAVLTATGFYMIYRKLPTSVRVFMKKHALLTDFVSCILIYAFLGGTIVALFAAAFLGLIISIMLAIMNSPPCEQLLEKIANKLNELKERFMKIVVQYAEKLNK